jgi:hypothetical protein
MNKIMKIANHHKKSNDMGVFIAKQPNGKYCRFSTVVDSVTYYNMSEEDYIEMCAERVSRCTENGNARNIRN